MISFRPVPGRVPKIIQQAVRSGELVTIKIVKKLHGSSWQASIKGKLFPLRAEVPLKEGSRYPVQVLKQGSGIILRLVEDKNEATQLRETLSRDPLVQKILETLQKSSLPLDPHYVEQILKKVKRFDRDDIRFLRILTILLDKKVDMDENSIIEIIGNRERRRTSDHHGDDREGERKKQKRDNIVEKMRDTVKEQSARMTETGGCSLHLFNHIKSSRDNWIVIPFLTDYDDAQAEGSLRIKTDGIVEKPRHITVEVFFEGVRWFFSVDGAQETERTVRIYCSDEKKKIEGLKNIEDFSKKLTKLGLKTDDSIKRASDFDGFSEKKILLKTIDTVI